MVLNILTFGFTLLPPNKFILPGINYWKFLVPLKKEITLQKDFLKVKGELVVTRFLAMPSLKIGYVDIHSKIKCGLW